MKISLFMTQPIYVSSEGNYSCRYLNLIDFVSALTFTERIYLVTFVERGEGPCRLTLPRHVEVKPIRIGADRRRWWWRGELTTSAFSALYGYVNSEWLRKSDVIGFIAMNGINTVLSCYLSLLRPKPFFFLLRGNRVATASSNSSRALLHRFKNKRVRAYDKLLRYHIRKGVPVFTQGAGLEEVYGDIPEARIIPLNAMISKATVQDRSKVEQKLKSPFHRLLYVGRLSPEKGLLFLIEAFAGLIRQKPDIELHLVGSGPLEGCIRDLVSHLNLSNSVFLHGFVPHGPELFRYFDMCHALIMASYTEGLPRALLEAMARGLPVVATRVGGIPHAIQSGENGLLYDPDDSDGLRYAVLDLLQNPERYRKLVWNGYECVEEYTFETRGKRMVEYLEGFVKNVRA